MVLNVINARLVDYVGILDNGCKHLRNTSLKAFTTEQQKYFRFLSAYFSSKCFMKWKYVQVCSKNEWTQKIHDRSGSIRAGIQTKHFSTVF